MHLLLADVAPSPQSLYDFVLVLALFASIGGNLALIYATRSKARREVTFGFIPAAKEEFDKHVAHDAKEHDQLWAKLGGLDRGMGGKLEVISREWRAFVDAKLGEISEDNRSSREKIWTKVTQTSDALSELRGINAMQNQSLAQISAKLDRLAERKDS